MRVINNIVIHCSYTPPSMDIGVEEIRRWHVEDNGWKDIGYHVVIRRNGVREMGRPFEVVGAHVLGHNTDSLGICLVGGKAEQGGPQFNFTFPQIDTLRGYLPGLLTQFPQAKVVGHNEFDKHRACPTFDVGSLFGN